MDLFDAILENLGWPGRIISATKSGYDQMFPDHKVYFNACIFDSNGEQVWHGDVDFTTDAESIEKISNAVSETFYITPEHGFRSDFNVVTLEKLKTDKRVIIKN